jgi:hypothetical protein
MLRTALEFLAGELKAYIVKKEPSMFRNEIAVLHLYAMTHPL